MPLTDTAIRAAKPSEKQQKLFDGSGLYLLVFPSGSKAWRFKYHFQGREKLISLGQYPAVSLKDAREKAAEARKALGNGKDPSAERQQSKLQHKNSFEIIAREWHGKQAPAWSAGHAATVLRQMENNLFPHIGSKPVGAIGATELLSVLRKIESRDAVTVARIVRSLCSSVFRYAVMTGRAERDPATDIRGAISARATKNRAAITEPEKVGALLLAIDNYSGAFTVRVALNFMALTFCRPAEILHAEWPEFDFSDNLWRIPTAKMKMSRDHLVPLSRQAIAVLEEMRPYSGEGPYVFPGVRAGKATMRSQTLVAALRRMGFGKNETSAHGFRAMASTLLNEQGYPPDVIERQLAHVPSNQVRAAYNRAEYLPERRKMMDEWANYLGSLRERAKQEAQA
jgi:integrase